MAEMKKESYIRRPYSFFKTEIGGRKLRRSELAVLGAVYSFSSKEEARCRMSYARFADKLSISHATVACAIATLKQESLIEQDKSSAVATYKYTRTAEKGHVHTDLFLYHTPFVIGQEERLLLQSEIDVLSLIATHCGNERGSGFTGSVRGIARTLNLSNTTVQKALTVLLHARLIFRAAEGRGINGHKRSAYSVNEKMLRPLRKRFNKALEAPTARPRPLTDADVRADRERFYAANRARAMQRVEFFEKKLLQDPTYAELSRKSRALAPQIARAEIRLDADTVAALKKEAGTLERKITLRMNALGVSKSDLTPVFTCPKCSDTGFLPNGYACDCYPPTRRRRAP